MLIIAAARFARLLVGNQSDFLAAAHFDAGRMFVSPHVHTRAHIQARRCMCVSTAEARACGRAAGRQHTSGQTSCGLAYKRLRWQRLT